MTKIEKEGYEWGLDLIVNLWSETEDGSLEEQILYRISRYLLARKHNREPVRAVFTNVITKEIVWQEVSSIKE